MSAPEGPSGPAAADRAGDAAAEGLSPAADHGGAEPDGTDTDPYWRVASYDLSVNGSHQPIEAAWIGESLLFVLRERLGLVSAKDGCGEGECGACTVLMDGEPAAACLVPAVAAIGRTVDTPEKYAVPKPDPVAAALAAQAGAGCGFCLPGIGMQVRGLIARNPRPSAAAVREALSGNRCRCLPAERFVTAAQAAAARIDADAKAEAAHSAAMAAGFAAAAGQAAAVAGAAARAAAEAVADVGRVEAERAGAGERDAEYGHEHEHEQELERMQLEEWDSADETVMPAPTIALDLSGTFSVLVGPEVALPQPQAQQPQVQQAPPQQAPQPQQPPAVAAPRHGTYGQTPAVPGAAPRQGPAGPGGPRQDRPPQAGPPQTGPVPNQGAPAQSPAGGVPAVPAQRAAPSQGRPPQGLSAQGLSAQGLSAQGSPPTQRPARPGAPAQGRVPAGQSPPQGQSAQPRQGPARPPAARPAPPIRGLLDLEATELDNPDFGGGEFPVRVFETGSLRASDIEDWDPAADEEQGARRQGMRQRPSPAQAAEPERTDRGGRGAEKW
ncbi:MAG TPA: 2Fe-2S iron-sulfur cluster-binding protein [Actinocrinis sp.]